jgi:hypothetical protein
MSEMRKKRTKRQPVNASRIAMLITALLFWPKNGQNKHLQLSR